jgi:Spy/CpxP family protein refolding chaperone
MRNLTKVLLIAGLAVAFVSVAIAQRGPGGFQVTEATLLTNKDIQKDVEKELKLTDAQKEKIAKITDKMNEAMKKAREDKDFQAFAKIREDTDKAVAEVAKDFKPEQAKRLKQLTLQAQMASPFGGALSVLTNEDVQRDLKLDDKQKDKIKTIAENTRKDTKDVFDAAKGDKEKFAAAREQVAKLNKEAGDKIMGTLTDDQKKLWKDMLGEKSDIKFDSLFQFGGGFGKDKGKGKDKKKDN